MNRAFKGIWIPKEIWLEKELNWVEKILLVEIASLDNEQGCWASNAYFAEFFSLSKNRISILINSLKEKGYVTVELQYKAGTKQIEKRIIRNTYTYMRKQIGGITEKEDTPICENAKDNNTSFNNTINNTKDIRDIVPPKKTTSSKPPARHKYGQYKNVLLNDFEMEKLQQEFPSDWENRIEKVSEYVEASGKKYKNFLAVIRSWAKRDAEKPQKRPFYQNKARTEILPDWANDDYDYRAAEEAKRKEVRLSDGELPEIDLTDELPL